MTTEDWSADGAHALRNGLDQSLCTSRTKC